MNKQVQRVIEYVAAGKDYRRWRMWRCIEGPRNERCVEAREEIAFLESKGFKAKIYSPLPQHQSSNHTHIVVLTTFREFCKIGRVPLES